MKKITIAYWVCTGLLSALMLMSAITNIMVVPEAVTMLKDHLGYPVYIIPFLGVAKLLGVIALLFPRFPRLKEWAYAGFVIDLSGAMYSSIRVGDPVSQWAPIIIGFALIFASYILWHKKQQAATPARV